MYIVIKYLQIKASLNLIKQATVKVLNEIDIIEKVEILRLRYLLSLPCQVASI